MLSNKTLFDASTASQVQEFCGGIGLEQCSRNA
jgi:hypothetical protein